MIKGERFQANVRVIDWGAGQSPKTAQYGAEYIFKTNTGATLYWDTMSKIDIEVGDNINISFTIISKRDWLGKNEYDVKNVRLVNN